MKTIHQEKKSLKGLLNAVPQPTSLDQLVAMRAPADGTSDPVVCTPRVGDVNLVEWVRKHRDLVEATLGGRGAILFRGFNIPGVDQFREVVYSLGSEVFDYQERTSPRTRLTDKVYTSTDHPQDQVINMHNELSYSSEWPMKIAFFCVTPAAQGGETPIADVRNVYNLLKDSTLDKFRNKQVMYVRNMFKGVGLPWQEVYQTDDKRKVEKYCHERGVTLEWVGEDHLRTRWVRPAVHKHPVTGQWLWFNHAFFYNRLSFDQEVLEAFREEDLPFNTYYGDGSAIEPGVIEEIKAAFEKTKSAFPWKKGDLLLLDNMLVAHGRHPYAGERKVAVAMAGPSAARQV